MYKKELSHLSSDPVMARLVKKHASHVVWNSGNNLFEDLVESIISQQLSLSAAKTIFGRFRQLFGKKFPTPKMILDTPHEKLRSVGLSNAKAKYVKSLAEFIYSKELILDELYKLSNEEVIDSLTRVKGIGRWTAEMILIFSLKRSDVFSLGDLGLKKAVANSYKIDIGDIKRIEEISLKWSPYRSLACLILWKSLD